MCDYMDFIFNVRNKVLKKMTVEEIQKNFFLTRRCLLKTKKKARIYYRLLSKNQIKEDYLEDKTLEEGPGWYCPDIYAYERELIYVMSDSYTNVDIKISTVLDNIIQGLLSGFKKRIEVIESYNTEAVNEDVKTFLQGYNILAQTYTRRTHFSYMDDSKETLVKLNSINELQNHIVNETLNFFEQYKFFTFIEVRTPDKQDECYLDEIFSLIKGNIAHLHDKEKGITLLKDYVNKL